MDDFYLDPRPYHGRPASDKNRLKKELACYDLLDRLEIPFDRADHSPAMTIPMCEEAEKVLGERICKNLFLCNRQKTDFYLLLMDGEKAFKTKDLSKQLGVSRLSFGAPEDMERLLGVTPGSATVLALMNDPENRVKLVMDRSVAESKRIGCHPCINTSSIAFSTAALLEKVLPALGHEPVFVDLPEEEPGNAMLVQLPCTETHIRWLREAAGDRCRLLFPADADAAEATCVFGEPTVEELKKLPRVRWIQMSWAGVDRYTAAPGFPPGVRLTCATGAYGGIIAEYVIGAIVAMYRHFPAYVREMDRAAWKPCLPGRGIEGKTVLILGAGDIGTELARRLRPFHAKVVGVRRTKRQKPAEFDEMYTMADLPGLWERADILVCALPSTPETAGLLDEANLRRLKSDALLVNVGRGTLLDTRVLAEVMGSGHLLGAVLDVCDREPLPPEHPLWKLDNVFLTPHIAGIGFGNVPETSDKIVRLCCRNLKRWLDGQPLESLVDLEAGYRKL